jgi:hypothetical protein
MTAAPAVAFRTYDDDLAFGKPVPSLSSLQFISAASGATDAATGGKVWKHMSGKPMVYGFGSF